MFIEFSEFNLKLLILLIFPVFKRLGDISSKAYITKDNQVFKTFRYYLCYSFSFVPFLIIISSSKRENKNNGENFLESKEKIENNNSISEEKSQINYFTPCHYFISRYFSEYVNYLIKANGNKNEFYSTTNIVIISVVFFINL